MRFRQLILLGTMWLPTTILGQEAINYNVEASGVVSSESSSPFFFTANRHGVISPSSNAAYLRGEIDYTYQYKDIAFKAALDIVGTTKKSTGYYGNLAQVQQAYAQLDWQKLGIMVGQRELSPMLVSPDLSSGNMVWSGNSRPIPQVKIGTNDFVSIPGTDGWLNLYADFAFGRQFDGNYNKDIAAAVDKSVERRNFTTVENAAFHRKNIFLRSKAGAPFVFTIGVEHVAQFGGTINGQKAPAGMKDAFNVLFVKSENSPQWQYSHMASLDLRGDVNFKEGTISGYVQLFMDEICKEGSARQNGSDGLWGLEWKSKKTGLLSNIVLEYLQTTNGNGHIHADGKDKYTGKEYHYYGGSYNDDQLYGAWANYGMNCGTPLMKSPAYNETPYPSCTSSIIKGFHLGAKGDITPQIDYRLLLSYHKSWGTFVYLLPEPQTNTSCMIEASYHKNDWTITPALAFDSGKIYGDNVGLMISIKKTGNLLK